MDKNFKYNNLAEVLCDRKTSEKGITFIKNESTEEFLSYGELYNKALNVLSVLKQNGIKDGDELVFQISDNKVFICVFWACILGSIIPVPITVGNKDEYREKLIRIWNVLKNPYLIIEEAVFHGLEKYINNKPKLDAFLQMKHRKIFTEEILEGKQEYISSSPCSDDIALIQFSSGSTGDPKGVILTHSNLLHNAEAIKKGSGMKESDRTLNWMPLTHDMGLIGYHISSVVANVDQFIMNPLLFGKEPLLWLKKASEHKATHLYCPNFGFSHVLKVYHKKEKLSIDLSNIKVIYNGAEPISVKLCKEFLAEMEKYGLRNNTMFTVYGLAEASVAVAFPAVGEPMKEYHLNRKYLNVLQKVREINESDNACITFCCEGKAVDFCQIRICDEDNHLLENETIGYIQIRGKNVTSGYYNNPKETKDLITKDGWVNTGDLGFIKDNNLVVTGRQKEIIIIDGQNYYPFDLERVAEEIQSNKAIACAISDRQNHTEKIVVFIQFKKGLEEFRILTKELKQYLFQKGGWEIFQIIPIRSIPKTTSGKIKRYKLVEDYENGEFDSLILELESFEQKLLKEERMSAIQGNLKKILEEELDKTGLAVTDSFFDMGVNSLKLALLENRIHELYPNQVKTIDFFTYSTIEKLAEYIDNHYKYENKIEKKENSDSKTIPDIAIIGIGLKMPMAETKEEFFQLLEKGTNCIREIPNNRREQLNQYHQLLDDCRSYNYLEYGYLDDIYSFDYQFFKLTPKDAMLMDPAQRLFLEAAYTAIENAGYAGEKIKATNTGVYLGYIADDANTKYRNMVYRLADESDYKIAVPGNLSSIIPSRISYMLDLNGPSMLIDTACSSSLVAVHLACEAIRNGDCNMAISGGVKINALPIDSSMEKIGIESAKNRTCAFDEEADGTAMGEGVVAILLKSLDQAVKDGDIIHGVIKASSINQDGKSNGITAPNVMAQKNLLIQTWKKAKINPENISYIEAHGTGTKVGDPIEIEGIQKAFEYFTDRKQFCAIGSLKSNIGHLYAAAGIAGLVKLVMSLKTEILPPSINFRVPNKKVDFINSPVYVNNELSKWERDESPLIGAISSFGFSGTNAHIVLEEYKKKESKAIKESIPRIFTLSALNKNSLKKLILKYISCLANSKEDFGDISYTVNTGRGHYNFRIAIIATNLMELLSYLNIIAENDFQVQHERIYVSKKELKMENLTTKLISFEGIQEEETLHKICDSYVKGTNIDFSNLYIEGINQKVELPTYEYDKKVCFIGDLNQNDIKNIDDNELDKLSKNEIEKNVIEVVKKVLGLTDIDKTENFYDIGADSIQLTELSRQLSKLFSISLLVSDLFSYPSVEEFVAFIENKLSNEVPKSNMGASIKKSQNFSSDIAIVGIALNIPGANNIEEFWDNLEKGKDCIIDFPKERILDIEPFLQKEDEKKECKFFKGGFLKDIDQFDYRYFKLSPKEAELMNPNQRLFLEIATEAFLDAGYTKEQLSGSNTGVYIGYGYTPRYNYSDFIFQNESDFNPIMVTGNLNSVIAGRISYHMNLKGASLVLDTACSSSLVAVHTACRALINNECDMALSGGIKLNLVPIDSEDNKLGIESPDYKTRAFDKAANGTAIGEGVIAVVLKKLDNAIQDRNQVYAVIKGSAVNHDGTSLGLTAPNSIAQTEVICKAWENANINPESITYIETHGTGTKLGDSIELEGLTQAFRKYTNKQKVCGIGSVKTNIGHLFEAAGAAGLVKAVLCLKHKKIVPSIHYLSPNENINLEDSPVYVNDKLKTWDNEFTLRRCGVSAFGLSGTNCHMVLEEYVRDVSSLRKKDYPTIFVLTGKSIDDVKENAIRLLELDFDKANRLLDLCFTLAMHRKHFDYRIAFVVNGVEDFYNKIGYFINNYDNEELDISDIYCSWIENLIDPKSTLELQCEKFVRNVTVNWNTIFTTNDLEVVSIPFHLFQKERCWITPNRNINSNSNHLREEYENYILNHKDEIIHLEDGLEVFNRFIGDLLAYEFYQLGVINNQVVKTEIEELRNETGILEKYHRLFKAILSILEDNGYVKLENDTVIQLPVIDKIKEKAFVFEEREKYIRTSFANLTPYMDTLMYVIKRYKDVLLGSIKATEVLFPNGEMYNVENVYSNNRMSNFYHEFNATILKSFIKNKKIKGKIKILEIGAGTGATTQTLLEAIREFEPNYIYTYTDISYVFLEYGKQKLAQYDFVEYKILDIEKNILEQGFTEETFDLIIATNVLHTSSNIMKSIKNISSIVKKNGMLFLNELTSSMDFSTVIFGLLEDWWRYEDANIRIENTPLLSYENWKKILEQNGFKNAYTFDEGKATGQSFIIAERAQRVNVSKELPRVELKGNTDKEYSRIEYTLAQIYKEVLGLKVIDINASFYEIGGDSILATKLTNQINNLFDIQLKVSDILKLETFELIAERVQANINFEQEDDACTSLKALPKETKYPLSKEQLRMFTSSLIESSNLIGYNTPEMIQIEGKFPYQKLREACNELVNNHEILRTSYELIDEIPYQLIHENIEVDVEYYKADANKADSVIYNFIRPFDLSKPPLFRVGIIKCNEENYILLLDFHHIISDGWTISLFVKELVQLLEGKHIEKGKIQYKDYCKWQEDHLKSKSISEQKLYWKNKGLDSIKRISLPCDFPRPEVKDLEGNRIMHLASENMLEGLNRISRKNKTSLFVVMFTAYSVLLSRYARQQEFIIGIPTAGRPHKDFQEVLGMFVNMLPIIVRVNEEETFEKLLQRNKNEILEVFENKDYQFDDMVKELNIQRDMGKSPLFDYVFAMQNMEMPKTQNKEFKLSLYEFMYRTSRFDMFLSVTPIDYILRFRLEYATSLFREETSYEILYNYEQILNQIIENEMILLKDILLFSNYKCAEKIVEDEVLEEFNF